MVEHVVLTPSDWDRIELVAFDVDGTLYKQRSLRIRMARDVVLHAMLNRDFRPILILRAYRRIRERLSDEEVGGFDAVLAAETAKQARCSQQVVADIVAEWIEHRPLAYLAGCRYPGLPDLFSGLRRTGKIIGVLSDYPAETKLAALGLAADYVVSAGDDGIGFLKPHPRGLEALIAAAGTSANTTVLIGDRTERDGLVAQRLGVRALIRSSKPLLGWQTFAAYDDPLFAPLLAA